MPLTTRVLPREEYAKLAGTEADAVFDQLPPAARVVVVEDGARVVGCHVLLPVVHAECLWVHPDHRGKGSVARRLWRAVKQEAADHFQVRSMWTAAENKDIVSLLEHVGATEVPCRHFMLPVNGV